MKQHINILLKNRGKTGIKQLPDPKDLIEYSNIWRMSIKLLKSTAQAENAICK